MQPHHRVLPPQLHRGAVPLLGHHQVAPTTRWRDMVRIVRTLREEQDFRGYIHLKTIPGACPTLVEEAGLYADRLSVNVELPTEASPRRARAREGRGGDRAGTWATSGCAREAAADAHPQGNRRAERFAPAGQSTQMIVGADATDDATILRQSSRLYGSYGLKRVYYSAFSPIPDVDRQAAARQAPAPARAPALPGRLADALLRLRRRGDHRGRRTATSTSRSTPSWPGRCGNRELLPRRRATRPARDAAARAGLRHQDGGPHPRRRGAIGRSATTTSSAWARR